MPARRRRRRRRPANNAQNLTVLLGKIIRIDPRSDAFPADPLRDYAIPAGNPFAGGGGRPEIWAYGLRNPFRNGFDPLTQNLWIGDVGQGAREEIDLMRPTDGGANFGWRIMEGTAVFNGPRHRRPDPAGRRIFHGSGPREGNSVTGGYVYRGPVEALRGNYFFADFVSRQHLVDPDRPDQPRRDPAEQPVHPAPRPISRPMPARSTMSPASASTRRAISTSSTSTARSSGWRRA